MATADGALIERSQQGDLHAFDLLVAEYEERIYHLAYRITGNPQDAQDAAQETFVKAFRALPRYRHAASFHTWLYRIATNAALDIVRRRSHSAPIALEEVMVTGPTSDPAEEAQRREIHRRVHAALVTLAPDHRTIVLLRDLEGFAYEEIAEVLRIPVGTVRSRLSRAREALRPLLRDLAPCVRSREDCDDNPTS